MRFRRLVLRMQTTDGPYGAQLDFPDGLTVIWADNSMGKSTCVRSLLVSLGMEAMLTSSRSDLPLSPASKARLESDHGEHDVLESEVFLEIENANGRRIVTQRTIKGARDRNLVTVHNGPVLTSQAVVARTQDYFVNLQGAATRESGFHHFLATFLGWSIPLVQSFDGSERPLYLQCIFPYFVVEQTRGWSTLQPPIPNHLRIRDAHKRVVEYVLNLDAHQVALERQQLLTERVGIESDWKARIDYVEQVSEMAAGTVQALPRQPTAAWPPRVPPVLVVPSGEHWIPLSQRLEANRTELSQLIEEEIPRVQEIASAAQSELHEAESETRDKQALLSRLLDELEMEQAEVTRVEHRLGSIAEDIQRHKDIRTLQSLGSRQNSAVDSGQCPVCHQHIQDSLLPLSADQVVMSLDESIQFLTEQKRTFELVLTNARHIAGARTAQVRTLNQDLDNSRERIRTLRQTLISDARMPSAAAIRTRIELENLVRRDDLLMAQFIKGVEAFGELADRWRRCQEALNALPTEDTTEADRQKLALWSSDVRNQLSQYGFRSLSPTRVTISPDTYKPEHLGFELQPDVTIAPETTFQLQNSISASDLIRTIWAYLSGMLELSRTAITNHPGCIIFDEPRQQSTRDVSFAELLKRASAAGAFGQQIIFFTSENPARLREHLDGVPHSLVEIEGRVLKKQ